MINQHPRNTSRRFPRKPRAGRPRANPNVGPCTAAPAVATAAAMAAGWLCGCARSGAKSPAADDSLPPQEPVTLWNSPHFQGVEHPSTVVASEGAPPLLFNLKRGDHVRVIDVTVGKQLADAVAAGPAIVNIEPSGLFIGDVNFAAGPLAADHKYQILLDVDGHQSWSSGIEIAPIRQPQTTRPAPQH